jgi:Sec-independent protein translocase protein TatA
MLNLDPAKLVVILVLALVVMGPEKMQSSARHLGAMWRSLSEFREKAEQQVREALPDLDLPRIPASPRAAISGYVTDLLSSPTPTPSEAPAQAASVSTAGVGEYVDGRAVLGRRIAASAAASPREDDVGMN